MLHIIEYGSASVLLTLLFIYGSSKSYFQSYIWISNMYIIIFALMNNISLEEFPAYFVTAQYVINVLSAVLYSILKCMFAYITSDLN